MSALRSGISPSRDREGAGQRRTDSRSVATPPAYLITFTCYGVRLHGDESCSVDRRHNIRGTPFLQPSPALVAWDELLMKQRPYLLDHRRVLIVLNAVREMCGHRGWMLFAAHIRSTHVHAVVSAEKRPELVMNAFKSYASRALNRAKLDEPARMRWARHGSTRYLWKPEDIGGAVHYVVREQGEPMAVWENSDAPG
jgi:REP element-mobilizing transposase RayT